jgi:hypothetical protein
MRADIDQGIETPTEIKNADAETSSLDNATFSRREVIGVADHELTMMASFGLNRLSFDDLKRAVEIPLMSGRTETGKRLQGGT